VDALAVSCCLHVLHAVAKHFRSQVEMDDTLRIWRNFQLGKLMDLTMLDTRQYDRSITDLYWNTHYIHKISNDAGRSMMGSRQENWFYNTLKESKARNAIWRVIGSQTVFSRINESISYGNVDPLDYDAWDGYQGNRNRTFNVLMSNNIVISGDSHANWVSDLVWLDHANYDPATGKGSLGVEFAGTAVSSQSPYGQNLSLAQSVNYSRSLIADNQELQWSEVYYRGYFELRVSKNQVDAEYFGMPTIVNRNPHEISLANFTVIRDGNALKRVGGTTAMGGEVENGAVKFGKTIQTNITNSTDSGLYYISHDNQEDL
jgi:alkaline phosphatase D